MVRQHHQLNGKEFEQTPGDSKGQAILVHRSPWDHKESDTTYQLNNNNNNNVGVNVSCQICSWCAQIGLEYYPTQIISKSG